MKRNLYLIVMLLSVTVFSSCEDFLEESSQSDLVPTSTEDLKSLMYSAAYPYQLNAGAFLDLLTDDVKCNGLTDPVNYVTQFENGTGVFTFDQTMFDGNLTFTSEANLWSIYYEKINGCNIIIDYLDEVSGTEEEKNSILGQVLFLRGFYYLKLALTYCNIYSENADSDLGLPLVLSMYVSDDFPSRSTLADTYDQIESDFLKAAELLSAYGSKESNFRLDENTVYAMLSRYYLYKGRSEDLASAIQYADLALESLPRLTSLESFQSDFQYYGIYNQSVGSEAYWVYGTSILKVTDYYPTPYGTIYPYSVSDSLSALYEPGDLRPSSYLTNTYSSSGTFAANGGGKIGSAILNYGANGIRNVEVYLNRAEAKIRLYLSEGNQQYGAEALADLNYIRENRFSADSYEMVQLTDANELLDFCLKERRRELCFEEGIRWYDIKRLNLSVRHEYIDINNVSSVYMLNVGDPLYALPIPYDAMERNYKLEQNPR